MTKGRNSEIFEIKHMGCILGLSHAKPGVGLSDPSGSLPTVDIGRFYTEVSRRISMESTWVFSGSRFNLWENTKPERNDI